ncbi:hypothetical protein, partial [Variovorax soli]|uniref:hypothetical protein n=1 Tax=Variovorax soli TaxID=376815 RepID=UPI00286ADC41
MMQADLLPVGPGRRDEERFAFDRMRRLHGIMVTEALARFARQKTSLFLLPARLQSAAPKTRESPVKNKIAALPA